MNVYQRHDVSLRLKRCGLLETRSMELARWTKEPFLKGNIELSSTTAVLVVVVVFRWAIVNRTKYG